MNISGIVQGVGFRPFVYGLAKTHGLTGHVANTAAGVVIEIDGSREEIEDFVRAVAAEKPPMAEIQEILLEQSEISPAEAHHDFKIVESFSGGSKIGPITPDTDVCANCLSELFEPADRRYLYPFINCTNCGPRYTLIEKTPYDRPLTSMKHFALCERCQAEYSN